MHNLKRIRLHLGVTQKALAAELGCCQGNISNIESGQQTLLPDFAQRLIVVAASRGLNIDARHVYGPADFPLPELLEQPHA